MSKVYVVIRGRGPVPSVYSTWDECKKCVDGFRGAQYQSFNNLNDANAYITRHSSTRTETKSCSDIPIVGRILAYVDGSSMKVGAGYGVVLVEGSSVKEYSGKITLSNGEIATNNYAELYAIAVTIENTQGPITIFSDSEYSINCLTLWYKEWQLNDWKSSRGEPVMNKEIIQYILNKMKDRGVCFEHIKGHAGHKYNELADTLAKRGAQS